MTNPSLADHAASLPRRSRQAWEAFCQRIAELGGVVLEPGWLGINKPHRCLCANGHECTPTPNNAQTHGICRICAQNDPATAQADFNYRISQLGGIVLEPAWLGRNKPHRCLCPARHECSPRPASIKRGQGMCKTCAGRDPVAAWKNFRQRVTELGGIVLELAWQGALTPHLCRCANGHECRVIPNNIQQGQGLCRICADRNNTVTAKRKSANAKAFYQRVAELGGTVLEPEYLGSEQPHLCLCAAGHECRPTPHSLQSGQGMCKICAWQEQDVLYVVRSPVTRYVKFGITSNGGTSRLRHHRYAGFTEVIYLRAGLPRGVAICTEQEIKAALAVIGAVPAQGREFFNDKYVGTILDEINRRIF